MPEFYVAKGVTSQWPDVPGNRAPGELTFEDVLLVPQLSDVESRKSVDTTVQFGPYTLTKPIISAPMDTISGERMIRALAKEGAIGTLPRANDDGFEENLEICERLTKDGVPCLYAVGMKNGFEEARQLKERGAQMVLVDVAHGGMEQVIELAKRIKKELGLWVVAGNISIYPQAQAYQEAEIAIARVGVGPGGLCKTRLVAGTGYPQLSAIFETTSSGIYVIADGGIRLPADFAKAIAAGANIVMLGSMLAGTNEAPGEIVGNEMVVRGQASREYMADHGVLVDENRSAEGITTTVPLKGPVAGVLNELMGGLRSAMSYAGARTIKEFHERALFGIVSQNAQAENGPHITRRLS